MDDWLKSQASPAASVRWPVTTVDGRSIENRQDLITSEEPLEIRVVTEAAGKQSSNSIAVTMRTPGDDFELAVGFLVSEGVVTGQADIWRVAYCEETTAGEDQNIVEVYLSPAVSFDLDRLSRNIITSSSCGICGKTSIESVEAICKIRPEGQSRLGRRTLMGLPETLQTHQPVFSKTGGLHAAALFDQAGELILRREDVGRHNALDKMVGALLMSERLPASDQVLLVSGRVSFELVQKALIAGIPIVAAVGAPSSLAVELADSFGMTLIGFLRSGRFNVYCGGERLDLADS